MGPDDCWVIGPVPGRGGRLQLHWLTPDEHGHCDYAAPRGDNADVGVLRDGRRSAALEDRWPAPVVAALCKLLASSSRPVRIRLAITERLESDIARAWQRTPFEGLTLEGRPVTDRLILERESPHDPGGLRPATGRAVVLNTWYRLQAHEPDGVFTRVSPGVTQRLGYLQVRDFLAHETDLRSLGALVVIAHGASGSSRDHGNGGPFLARRGTPSAAQEIAWSLPSVSLPSLVVILACSSDRLELVDYASGLLQRGARCVLVPAGRIDASRAATFAGDFLQRWHAGDSVAEVLAALRVEYGRNLLDRLWLLGDGGLWHAARGEETAPARFGVLHTDQLQRLLAAERTRALATAALADRATLASVLAAGGMRATIGVLNHSLGAEGLDDEAGRRLHRQLDEAYPSCATITRGWLANYLMGLSERYDHGAMRRYRHAKDRDRTASSGAPIIMHFAAVAEAREGQFSRSARSLRRGFELLGDLGEDIPIDRLTLAGTLVNHLIDFNLPTWATTVIRKMLIELAAVGGDDAAWLEFINADRLSRAELRAGRIDAALAAMSRKRTEAIARGDCGSRELAWLVYISAWAERPPTKTQTGWVDAAVQSAAALGQSIDSDPAAHLTGNDDLTYLLRALAAWHWSRQEPSLHDMLERWVDVAATQIERGDCDPGPWGFLLGYLAAAGSTSAGVYWSSARAHMLDKDYRLEVLGLEALWGVGSAEQTCILRDFQRTRSDLVTILAPVLRNPALLGTEADLEGELRARGFLEQTTVSALPEDRAARKAAILASGLLPM